MGKRYYFKCLINFNLEQLKKLYEKFILIEKRDQTKMKIYKITLSNYKKSLDAYTIYSIKFSRFKLLYYN